MVYVWYGRPAGHLSARSGYAPCDDGRYPAPGGRRADDSGCLLELPAARRGRCCAARKPCGLCRTDEKVIHHAAADCGKPGGPRALLCDGADGPQRSRPDGPAAARKRTGAALRRQDLHAAFPDGGIGAKPSVGRPRAALCYRRRLACSGLPPSPGASAGRATGQPEFAVKAAPRRCDIGSVQP